MGLNSALNEARQPAGDRQRRHTVDATTTPFDKERHTVIHNTTVQCATTLAAWGSECHQGIFRVRFGAPPPSPRPTTRQPPDAPRGAQRPPVPEGAQSVTTSPQLQPSIGSSGSPSHQRERRAQDK